MKTRRVTYRLYPNTTQCDKLHWARKMHCELYNAAIANRRTQYKDLGHSVDYFEQQNCLPEFKKVWVEYAELGSHRLQATLKRVHFAYNRFFKGLGKYPKFKAKRRYSGWTYPDKASWRVFSNGKNGHLELRDLGEKIQMRGQARTWGIPTTCTIFLRNGKWYASITVQCELIRQTGSGSIGIDLGCKDAVALSTGEKIPKPDFIKAAEANGFYLESPTQKLKPTQRCAKCWELTPKTLADRVHVCSNLDCNHVEDRDINAAQVNEIWARGLERASLDAESPSSTSCGSMKQLGTKKRQKRRLQRSKSP